MSENYNRLFRSHWTSDLKSANLVSDNAYAKRSMLALLLFIMIERAIAELIPSLVQSGNPNLAVMLGTYIIVLTAFFVVLRSGESGITVMRFLFPLLTRIGVSTFLVEMMAHREVFGYAAAGLFLLQVVEFHLIVRHLIIEVGYAVLQYSVMLILILKLDYTVSQQDAITTVLTYFVFAVIISSVLRRLMDTDLFEGRYWNKDLQTLLTHLPMGVIISRQGEILLQNAISRDLVAQYDAEAKRKTFLDHIEEELTYNRKPELNGSIVEQNSRRYLVTSHPIGYLGQPSELIFFQNFPEAEQAREEEEESRQVDFLKNSLFRIVSDDYRTPINVILNALQVVGSDSRLPSDLLKLVELSQRSAKHLGFLVSDLLDYYQLKVGVFMFAPNQFDLIETLQEVINLIKLKAEVVSVTIRLEVNHKVSTTYFNDCQRVQQVAINLLTNAIKYSSHRSEILVKVSRDKLTEPAKIEIIDRGLGMKPENSSIIFDEFGRILDQENERKNPKGVGLGLWTSKQISAQLGKGIDFSSEYGRGSNFWFYVDDKKRG